MIAALLPMGFVSGMMGPYMAPIPALGMVATIFSLFPAFIFIPWLAQLFSPPIKALQRIARAKNGKTGFLRRCLQ